jgi:hypothetical protein
MQEEAVVHSLMEAVVVDLLEEEEQSYLAEAAVQESLVEEEEVRKVFRGNLRVVLGQTRHYCNRFYMLPWRLDYV